MTFSGRIVLTRQRESNRTWAMRLESAGLAVLDLPLVRFVPLAVPLEFDVAACDWILFTSPQGVRAFAAAGLDPRTAQVAALGPGTAAVFPDVGLRDDLGLATADGAELAVAFAAAVPAPAKVLLPGPAKRLREPRNTLERAGFTVTELPLYATAIVPAAELPATPLAPGDIVFFCSPSAVRAFVGAWSERPDCVAIGETTAATARDAGFPTRVAATPDLEAMVLAAGLDPIPAPATPRSGS